MESKEQEIRTEFDRIIGNNQEVTDDTHMDLVNECIDYVEALVNKLFIARVCKNNMKSKEQEFRTELHVLLLGHGIRDYSRRELMVKDIYRMYELFESKIDRSKPLPFPDENSN